MLQGVSRGVGVGLDWQGNKVLFAMSVRVLLLGRSRGLGGWKSGHRGIGNSLSCVGGNKRQRCLNRNKLRTGQAKLCRVPRDTATQCSDHRAENSSRSSCTVWPQCDCMGLHGGRWKLCLLDFGLWLLPILGKAGMLDWAGDGTHVSTGRKALLCPPWCLEPSCWCRCVQLWISLSLRLCEWAQLIQRGKMHYC